MATAFAQQLRQIAAHSTNELHLKARRNAHAESLLFEQDVAIKQDWDTLFQICLEGYQELCTLDPRLRQFDGTLFSSASKTQDREQMNKAQNEDLDNAIYHCLQMLGPRLSLRPGLRSLEWLIRRFRIHVHNVGMLLLTVLPYHEVPLFQNVLSLMSPTRLSDEWKFLRPYHSASTKLPRHTIVYAATTNEGFFSAFNEYTLDSCRKHLSESGLMRFWGSIVIEAVTGRLKQARSGRQEVQRHRTEDVLRQVLPILSEGLSTNLSPDLTTTCFALSLILGTTGLLDDSVIDSLLDTISRASSYSGISVEHALSALVILTSQKRETLATRKVVNAISQLPSISGSFITITRQYPSHKFFLAVINTILRTTSKKNYDDKIKLLQRIFREAIVVQSVTDVSQWLVAIVSEIKRLERRDAFENSVRARLIALLQELSQVDAYRPVFIRFAGICDQHNVDLEGLLQTTIVASTVELEPLADVESDGPTTAVTAFHTAIASVPSQLPPDTDFFASKEPTIFPVLVEVLLLCDRNQANLDQFKRLDVWSSLEKNSSQYWAFLLRAVFSNMPANARIDAATLLLSEIRSYPIADPQCLLPYLSVLLADDIPSVRRTVAAAVVKIQEYGTQVDGSNGEAMQLNFFAASTPKLDTHALLKILSQLYLPNLEEIMVDRAYIGRVVKHTLNGTVDSALKSVGGEAVELKRTLRQSILELFAHHAVRTNFFRFKLGMIDQLEGVSKAGSVKKTEALLPILKDWASLKSADVFSLANIAGISPALLDKKMASLLTAQDNESIIRVLGFVDSAAIGIREGLVNAVFDRVAEIWKEFAGDTEHILATRLFDLSFTGQPLFARGARAALQQVELKSETLSALLGHAMAEGIETPDQPPPAKKRRTSSHGAGKVSPMSVFFRQSLLHLSLALEIVEGSRPEAHPSLLPHLTAVLLHLRRVRDNLQAESPYLLNVCLGCILAIVEKIKTARRPTVDWNSIRADLIADCVRMSESSEVQTQALMLCASLATIAPDKVIHHIMPVFTFMGRRMVSQNDQHSIIVMNQAIDHIIPPLVATLRKQDASNLVQSTKNVLSSFVASFDHIPDERRVPLFQRLLRQLGPAEFGFVIIAMLANRGALKRTLDPFVDKVFVTFPAEVYLATYGKLVVLTQDIFAERPHDAKTLLEAATSLPEESRHKTAAKILRLAYNLLSNKSLKSKIWKLAKAGSDSIVPIEQQFRECLLQTLQASETLRPHGHHVAGACDQCLVAVLQLVSARQLIESMPSLFDAGHRIERSIEAQTLRLLAGKLGEKGNTDPETASAALNYLAKLNLMINASEPLTVKYAAIECIDRISTKFGRRDPDVLTSSAGALAGEHGLGSKDTKTRILAALTLSSMVGIMREAAVPIVPTALQNSLKMVEFIINKETKNLQLHDAAFGLIASLVHHVSFMVSEDDLRKITIATAQCAFSELPEASAASRKDVLQEIARQIELDSFVSNLSYTWQGVSQCETEGMIPILDMLGTAIDHHTKAAVVRSADDISSFILQVFDLRRVLSTEIAEDSLNMDMDDLVEVEAKVNAIVLKFIYKLNDGVFRPIFEKWVDWATAPRDLSDTLPAYKIHRQTTLYNFLGYFFSRLKSIVTSYASYLIKPANEALSDFHKHQPMDSVAITFCYSLLGALLEAFQHDADGFFTAPSHFEPLARNLVAQLSLAANKTFRPYVFQNVLPAIVAFASAVQDTPSHHLTINHYLAHLRHAESQFVRLASIRAHLALTEDEKVGDEWVNNVVSGTTSAETLTTGEKDEGERPGIGGSGETMIYVNEMLEDDDEEVEREVRRWVRMVRERVGEDVFEA